MEMLFRTLPQPGLFRLFLALMVVFFHSVSFFPMGHFAVYVFFILSGYWITKMYNEKYSKYQNPYKVYIISRFFRLFPLYWVILIFTVVTCFILPTQSTALHTSIHENTLFIPGNILVLGINFINHMLIVPAWSLDVEVQYYIVAPLLLTLFIKGWGKYMVILSVIIAILGHYNFKYINLLIYLPFFLIGGLIYIKDLHYSLNKSRIGVIAAVVLLVANYVIPTLRPYFYDGHILIYDISYQEFINIMLAILFIPFVTRNVRAHVENRRLDMTLSSMSYVVYLLHWPLLLIYGYFVEGRQGIIKMIALALFYIACLLSSYLVSRFVDSKFETYRKEFLLRFKKAD